MIPHTGRYVVMGVAGAGKTLIGSRLARMLGTAFVEGDEFHPPANVAKMAAGVPLDDDDRAGWLDALAARIAEARREDRGLVVAASVLKRAYRDVFRAADPAVQFILLTAPRPVIADRLEHRSGHYMPPSLLDSQLATLEPPDADERAWTWDNERAPDVIVDDIAARIRRASEGRE
ncbi:MAG TPA: gluconokinase [Gemmatimonadaceae bacterium]|nr:gluconokinase [Gemmatimonadaceae bacterium]